MNENSIPKITIVTVTYNLINDGRTDFFRQCVKSVAEQSYPNIEHLIIDGASKDGTLDLIEECRHPRMKVISEPDGGMWDAMEKAIYIAEGKYLCYMNSDDYYYSNDIIEKCVKLLEDTSSEYLVGNFKCTYRNDGKISDYHENIPPLPKENFWKGMTYNHETLICKVDTYKKYGSHNLKYQSTIDYYWNIQLILNNCSYCIMPNIIHCCRLGGGTTKDNATFSDMTLKNVFCLWQDLWKDYPLTKEESENILTKQQFSLPLLDYIEKDVLKRNIKNFDYKKFKNEIKRYKEIEKTRIFAEFVLKNETIFKIYEKITEYKKDRYDNIEDRIKAHIKRHVWARYLAKVLSFLCK